MDESIGRKRSFPIDFQDVAFRKVSFFFFLRKRRGRKKRENAQLLNDDPIDVHLSL